MQSSSVHRYGVKNFWFDASEPENLKDFGGQGGGKDGPALETPLGQPQGALYSAGSNQQVGMMYPYWHAKMAYDGLKSAFPDEVPVTLSRSAWVGASKFGASSWNGDLCASWNNFQKTIVAGLNAQLSGIAWWTHDIGAINCCNNSSPEYRELLLRWFAFGVTSPIFRQHGSRVIDPWALQQYGASGEAAYQAVTKMIRLRYTLRPYVLQQMETVAANGVPLNRPLSFDFPEDPRAWRITDQFMFGSKYMAAPVYRMGERQREVYFPKASRCGSWRAYAGASGHAGEHKGGETAAVRVPLDELLLFECVAP